VAGAFGGVGVVRSEVGDVAAASAPVAVRALVALAGLEPDDVTVEAVGDGPAAFAAALEPGAADGEARWFEGSFLAPQGSSDVRIRVLPRHPDLADPRTLGLVAEDHD
jgi:glycogen phosphorylase